MNRMLNRKLFILSFVLLILVGLPCLAFAWSGKVLEVEPVDIDRYNRLVALVTAPERSVNEELLNAGFVWVYTRYCDRPIYERWKVLENEAREAKRGLWADPNPLPPWSIGERGGDGQ